MITREMINALSARVANYPTIRFIHVYALNKMFPCEFVLSYLNNNGYTQTRLNLLIEQLVLMLHTRMSCIEDSESPSEIQQFRLTDTYNTLMQMIVVAEKIIELHKPVDL